MAYFSRSDKHAAAGDMVEIAQYEGTHTQAPHPSKYSFLDYCNYIDMKEFCGVHCFSRSEDNEELY